VTAKDLTEEDRQRLNGGVERIIEKGALTRTQLLTRVREFVEKTPGSGRGNRWRGWRRARMG